MTIQTPPQILTLVDIFPAPGDWTESEYLQLSDRNLIVELSEGHLEIQPMPTSFHQIIVTRLTALLYIFATQAKLGIVSTVPVRLWPGKMREPDIMFMLNEHKDRIQDQDWDVPDLAIEVLSPSSVDMDKHTKGNEYARAGIPEYWIIDPETKTTDILRLSGGSYQTTAHLTAKDKLTSLTFPGFELSLAELFAKI